MAARKESIECQGVKVMSFLVARARGETDTLQCLIGHVFLRALLVCESVSKQVSVRQGKKNRPKVLNIR